MHQETKPPKQSNFNIKHNDEWFKDRHVNCRANVGVAIFTNEIMPHKKKKTQNSPTSSCSYSDHGSTSDCIFYL